MRQCHLFCRTFFPQNGQISRADKKMAGAERRTKKARLEFLDRVLRRQTASFCPLPPATPMTCRRKSETAPTNGHQKMTQQQQQKPSNGAANGGSVVGNGAVKQPSHQQQPVGQQQQHSQKPVVPNKVVDKGEGKSEKWDGEDSYIPNTIHKYHCIDIDINILITSINEL
jgi:hypothetical protein